MCSLRARVPVCWRVHLTTPHHTTPCVRLSKNTSSVADTRLPGVLRALRVRSFQDFIDVVLSKTQRQTPTVIHRLVAGPVLPSLALSACVSFRVSPCGGGLTSAHRTSVLAIVLTRLAARVSMTWHCRHYQISRIRAFYTRKVKFTQQNYHDKLTAIIEQVKLALPLSSLSRQPTHTHTLPHWEPRRALSHATAKLLDRKWCRVRGVAMVGLPRWWARGWCCGCVVRVWWSCQLGIEHARGGGSMACDDMARCRQRLRLCP